MFKSESIDKIAPALLKAQQNMGAAIKSSSNPFFKSKFADLNAVREACLPALNAQGISVLQPTVVHDGKNYVETILLHESGQLLSAMTEVKTLKPNDPQAEGSGISYARRYGLQSFVNLAAEDNDAEEAMGRGKGSQGSAKQSATVTSITKSAAIEEQVAKHLNPTSTTPAVINGALKEMHAPEALIATPAAKTTFRKPQKQVGLDAVVPNTDGKVMASDSASEWM